MTIASYSDLKSSISSWMYDRSDLATVAGDFITLCEGDINRVLRGREQLTTTTLTLDSNSQASLPDDYLEYRSVVAQTTPRIALDPVSPGYRDYTYPFRSSSYPKVFTIDGSKLMVLPATTSGIELEYFAKVAALTETNTTNWLLTKFPNIYLYGSLKHAAVFIGDDDRMKTFGALFNGLLDAMVKAEAASLWASGVAKVRGATP